MFPIPSSSFLLLQSGRRHHGSASREEAEDRQEAHQEIRPIPVWSIQARQALMAATQGYWLQGQASLQGNESYAEDRIWQRQTDEAHGELLGVRVKVATYYVLVYLFDGSYVVHVR